MFSDNDLKQIYEVLSGAGIEINMTDLVLQNSENFVGIVGGSSDIISTAVANTAEAYVGTTDAPVIVGGKLTFTNALRVNNGTAIVQTVKMVDTDNKKPSLLLMLFNGDPTVGTYTNKSQPVYSTDITKFAGIVEIGASDWKSSGGVGFADVSATSKLIKATGDQKNLYGILLTTGSFTWTNPNTITVKLGVMRD